MKHNRNQNADDMEKLRRALEQATAADSTAEKETDPETGGLREAWLALGQLLSAAEQPVGWSLEPLGKRPARRVRVWAIALCALAASLLVCVATYMMPGTNGRQMAVAPAKQKSAEPADDATAWDDAMDQQFAQVGQNLISVEQGWSQAADSADMVQYGLQQIEQDVKENEL